jgi:hypothetical protein
MIGEELRQAHRTRLLTRSALVVLTVLTVTAFVSAALAPVQRNAAVEARRGPLDSELHPDI